jgi:hypothetical protein
MSVLDLIDNVLDDVLSEDAVRWAPTGALHLCTDPVPLMPVICQWLEANQIMPKRVPVNEIPTVTDRWIVTDVYVRTPRGVRIEVVDGERVPMRRTVRVPMRRRPPHALSGWLKSGLPHDFRPAQPGPLAVRSKPRRGWRKRR